MQCSMDLVCERKCWSMSASGPLFDVDQRRGRGAHNNVRRTQQKHRNPSSISLGRERVWRRQRKKTRRTQIKRLKIVHTGRSNKKEISNRGFAGKEKGKITYGKGDGLKTDWKQRTFSKRTQMHLKKD